MQEKEFVALVEKLEVYAREHPAAYSFRVALLAALGYLFLFGVVGIVLLIVGVVIYAGTINILVIKILIIPLGIAAVVLRSLWIEFPEPEGQELKYDDAPRLFDLAKEVRAATDGPTLHKVLLTDEYNAAIEQHPRLGVFGWQENYLLVGLPLLRALSPTDLRAVMAHEFGHLSGNHGKFSGWIYRVRKTWSQVLQNMKEHRRYGSGLFQKFFNWYAPYFAAYSYVLARAQEYEADRCSVDVSGKENAARALIKLELKERALNENFWPEFYKRADKQAEPPRESFTEMLESLRAPVAPEKAQLWFTQSLIQRHAYYDTHPALADRLECIGYANVRETANVNLFAVNDDEARADQYFLARAQAEFIERKNRWWQEALASGWTERHKFVAEAEQSLAALAEKAATTELTLDERWQRAHFTAGTQGNVAAIPFYKDVLTLMPDHAGANFKLGEALLEQGDETGIKHIEAAMETDVHAIPAGCEVIHFFLVGRERAEEAEKYRQCVVDYYDEAELARHERENITAKDDFVSHGLDQEALEALRKQLTNNPLLVSAYLVRKVVKHFPEEPCYILGIIARRNWYGSQDDRRDQALIDDLATNASFPVHMLLIALEHNYKPLRKVFKRIEGSEIYRA